MKLNNSDRGIVTIFAYVIIFWLAIQLSSRMFSTNLLTSILLPIIFSIFSYYFLIEHIKYNKPLILSVTIAASLIMLIVSILYVGIF